MSSLFGKYKAEVVNVNDPEKRGRIKVVCPRATNNNTILEWAECCFMDGFFSLPKRGDTVWVEFEEGHIDKPIWCGIVMTSNYAKRYGEYNVKKKMIVTEKHNVEINDESEEFILKSEGKVINDIKQDYKTTVTEGEMQTVVSQGRMQTTVAQGDIVTTASLGSVNISAPSSSLIISDIDGSFSPP